MKYVVMNGMSHYLIIHRNTSESYVGSFCLVMWQDQIMLKIITVLHVKLGQVGPYLPEVQVPGTGTFVVFPNKKILRNRSFSLYLLVPG